jgi:hypothetical protein
MLTDAIVWPDVFVNYWRAYKPRPHLNCPLSSTDLDPYTTIKWEISDLMLGTLLWSERAYNIFDSIVLMVIREPGMAQGQIVFNLTNLAIGYSFECTAIDKTLEPHNFHPTGESDEGWFDCVDNSLRVWDQVKARFRFNPDSGLFEIQQNWTCRDETGQV